MPVVEGAREAEVGAVEELAHPRLDADADARGRVPARKVDREAHDGERQDRDDVLPQRTVVAHDRVVDRTRDQDRDRQRDRRVGDRAGEAEGDQAPLLAPQAQQPAHRRPERVIRWVDLVDRVHVLLLRVVRAAACLEVGGRRGESV